MSNKGHESSLYCIESGSVLSEALLTFKDLEAFPVLSMPARGEDGGEETPGDFLGIIRCKTCTLHPAPWILNPGPRGFLGIVRCKPCTLSPAPWTLNPGPLHSEP